MGARAVLFVVSALFVAAVCPAAHAVEDAGFLGVGVLNWTYDETGVSEHAQGTGVTIRGGMELSDYFGVGAEIGGGGSDTVDVLGVDVELRLLLLSSVYVRGVIPLPRVNIYGLAGVTTVQLEAEAVSPPGPAVDDTSSGFTIGAGAEVNLAGNLFVGAQWVRYLTTDLFDLMGSSLFVRYRFE